MKSQKILISACLLGHDVKYDGKNNSILENPFIKKLLSLDMVISFCPEVEGGLPIPRLKSEIINNKVINIEKKDVTKEFLLGAEKTLEIVQKNDIKIAIMKSKSPSCGRDFIYDGRFTKSLIQGDGVTVRALKEIGVKVFMEDELEEAEKNIFK